MRVLQCVFLFCALVGTVAAQSTSHDMRLVKPAWNAVGPNLLPGAEISVLQGDLSKPELFTFRLRMPKGYVVAPHYHGTDLHVTIISGAFSAGMGDTVELAGAPILAGMTAWRPSSTICYRGCSAIRRSACTGKANARTASRKIGS